MSTKNAKKENNAGFVVKFLDIDTSKITFGTQKKNNYNGTQIPILYDGYTMYVLYEGTSPFGVQENVDNNGNYIGTSMQINLEGDYLEKAKELDQFFIDSFYTKKWSLAKSIPKSNIDGYDEHGQGGLWKRICKKPYKVDKETKDREYLDYPSRMEFALYYKNDKLKTTFFDWDNNKKDLYSEIGPRTHVKFIAAWFSLCRGTFGLTLKPKLMQVRYKPEESRFSQCLLIDSDEEEESKIEPIISLHPENCYDMSD